MGIAGVGLAIQVASAVASGVSGFMAAQGEKKRAEINAYIGRTRAIQTGNVARQNLESELGSYRSVLAGNGSPMDSANYDLLSEVRKIRERERRIGVANEMSGVYDQQLAAKNAGAKAFGSLISGFGRAAMPLSNLIQLM